MNTPSILVRAALSLALAAAASCSGSSNPPADSGAPADGGDAAPADGATTTRPACTVHLTPAGDVQTTVQTALINAAAGDVLCFDDGTYNFTRPLSLSTNRITLQGTANGAVLDFRGQTMGDNSIYVTGDGFTIQYLAIKNTQANGVRVEGADNVTFRGVHASWDAGSVAANGAYALYPVGCGHVLIEDCEVEGAADAGIYVGQSHDVIVRRNRVHGNVAGIEFENCTTSCGYENTATDNTAGILVFNLPGLMVTGTGHANLHHNTVDGNNHANFCHAGGIVCSVPVGIGIMVMAADHTEVHDNMIRNNESTGILVVDFRSQSMAPMGYDPIPTGVNIHDNAFATNAMMPHGLLASFTDPVSGVGSDILWDGYGTAGHSCADNTVNQVCVRNNGAATFRCGDAPTYSVQTQDIASHNCPGETETCATMP